jgi:hypothetical protein
MKGGACTFNFMKNIEGITTTTTTTAPPELRRKLLHLGGYAAGINPVKVSVKYMCKYNQFYVTYNTHNNIRSILFFFACLG